MGRCHKHDEWGKHIESHDLTMIKHELYEISLLLRYLNKTLYDAHKEAEIKFNYTKESDAFALSVLHRR